MRISLYILFAIFLLLYTSFYFSQDTLNRYRISFTDKSNTPFAISSPSDFLSPKAIARRTNQGIAIVQNDLPIDPAYVDSIRGYGVLVLNKSKWFNSIVVYSSDSVLIDSLQQLGFVKGIDIIGKQVPANITVPEKGGLPNDKWLLESVQPIPTMTQITGNEYGQAYNQISMLGGDILHSLGYRGQGMTIAVIDAGFRDVDTNPAFDSLFDKGQVLGTWDFVDGNDSVYDNGQHGLWVFSIIAANIPGLIVGTAPKANYFLLRSEDTNSEYLIEEDNWVSAAEFADSAGVDLISTSLGYKTFTDPSQNHTYADMDGNTTRISLGADIAASKGILVINSAGNSGGSSWQYIIAPADGDSVLAVGAVDGQGNYASFSSTGPSSDGEIKPNVVGQGQGTVTITEMGLTQSGNGTSFAAPVIAGMAACLWQAVPDATNMEIFNAIQESGSQANAPDNFLGYGIPNFMMAYYNLTGIAQDKDEDNDGVPDIIDKCLGTPYPAVVDTFGCSLGFEIYEFLNIIENPIGNSLSYLYYSETHREFVFEILDLSGRCLREINVSFDAESYRNISVPNLDDLSQGIYVLRISSGEKSGSRKLMKK